MNDPSSTNGEAHLIRPSSSAIAAAPFAATAAAAAAAAQSLISQPDANRERQRAIPTSTCPFDKLAAVEAQLVLQWLDTRSRLVAARCSRRLARESAAPFSWRGAHFSIRSDVAGAADRIRASPLLRAVPVHLTLVMAGHYGSADNVADVVAFPNLRSLDGGGLSVVQGPLHDVAAAAQFWVDLLSHPALQQIHSLSLPTIRREEQRVLQAVARLPRLHTLRCSGSDDEKAERFAPLAAAPALTSLAIHAGTFGRFLRPALAVCTKLTTFEVSGLRTSLLSDLCAEPTMRSLTCLNLHGMAPTIEGEQLAREYTVAFGCLQCLHTLELEGIVGVDLLLAHLPLASSLRRLVLTARPHIVSPYLPAEFRHTVPSVAALRALLDAAPHLLVQLHAPLDRDAWDRFAARRFINQTDEWSAVEAIDHERMPRVQRRILDETER